MWYSIYDLLLTFYSNYGSISCRFWDIQCRKLSWPWNRGQRSLRVIESCTIRYIGYGFLLVFCSNFVPKRHRFWDIRLLSIQWPWNPGWGWFKVVENYHIQSGTHYFLLTFHSNHRPISHRVRDKRRCMSKIERKSPNFSPPVFNAPMKGLPLEFGIGVRGPKCLNDEATRWSKSFQIGLVVLKQYWLWQTPRQPRSRSYYADH